MRGRTAIIAGVGLLAVLAGCGTAQPAAAPQQPAAPAPASVAATATPRPEAPASTPSPTAPPSAAATPAARGPLQYAVQEYAVPRGAGPHDVAPARDGGVWYTAQRSGQLGWLDPKSGENRMTNLGNGSAPHGVIVGPDGAPWITDGGLNAIVRVDPQTLEVARYNLPSGRSGANLNTAAFDRNGVLWFTGQTGIYGRLDPRSGELEVFDAPKGRGPYGITATPQGDIYYASLAGCHIATIDLETGAATVIEPPTSRQGARRVWSDSAGRIWVSEWNSGQVSVYDPAAQSWEQWKLPGNRPQTYAVYVDGSDGVWLSDFGTNAVVHFDPASETFTPIPMSAPNANVRQILGRPGEVWLPLSGQDKLAVVRVP